MLKNQLIKGTLILTIAGFITRILGFFYRIYLSNNLGTKNLGIYQLIFPIYSICYTLYASGIQTAISTLTAANSKKKVYPLVSGICLSLMISTFLSVCLYNLSDFLSQNILCEPTCSKSLKILSLIFPFCGLTSCINGFYYGIKKTSVPAVTQLIEQIARLLTFYMAAFLYSEDFLSCEVAVFALVIGELISCAYNILSVSLYFKKNKANKLYSSIKELMRLSIVLTSNRFFISILSSVESILIPAMLRKHGMSHSASLSTYGILTGMSLSIIFFPGTIINSLSVILLPTVSEDDSKGNNKKIEQTVSSVLHYCILIGILCVGIFSVYGKIIGIAIFNNKTAGIYICVLAWLCPFMYITTTLSSVLNGLSKPHVTFINSITGILIRIAFTIWYVPVKGIFGYLTGLLVSSLIISILDFFSVKKYININFNAVNTILKPGIIITFTCILCREVYRFVNTIGTFNPILLVFAFCVLTGIIYCLLLKFTDSLIYIKKL